MNHLNYTVSTMKFLRLVFLLKLLMVCTAGSALAEIQLFGDNPVFAAIKAGDLDAVKQAIARGERPEIEDFDGRTPVIYAGIFGNADIVDYLAEVPVSLNHKDKLGNTALYYAAERGHIDAVEALLARRVDLNAENRRGITPIMIAASQGRNEIVRMLLEHKADATRRDYTGRTALMWAEWNRKQQTVKLLRAAGVRE
jgi:ankyrin repeat protein